MSDLSPADRVAQAVSSAADVPDVAWVCTPLDPTVHIAASWTDTDPTEMLDQAAEMLSMRRDLAHTAYPVEKLTSLHLVLDPKALAIALTGGRKEHELTSLATTGPDLRIHLYVARRGSGREPISGADVMALLSALIRGRINARRGVPAEIGSVLTPTLAEWENEVREHMALPRLPVDPRGQEPTR